VAAEADNRGRARAWSGKSWWSPIAAENVKRARPVSDPRPAARRRATLRPSCPPALPRKPRRTRANADAPASRSPFLYRTGY